jgi:hypothetical protein
MKFVVTLVALVASTVCLPALALASPAKNIDNFHGQFVGNIVYFNPAGFEPDFDPIERVIIQTTVRSPHTPPMTLILDAYLENFQPDTTPILPDLIHPKVQVSSTLGGFFTGQAIVVAPGGHVLYTGLMLAEAFLTPQGVQHMILRLSGQGPASGGYINVDSVFHAYKTSVVKGTLYGKVKIPPAAMQALRSPGNRSLSLNQILKDFNVPRPTQQGTGGNGRPGRGTCILGHCTNVGTPVPGHPTATPTSSNPHSTTSAHPVWMTLLGGVFIGLAVILMVVFFFQRRTAEAGTPENDHADNADNEDPNSTRNDPD